MKRRLTLASLFLGALSAGRLFAAPPAPVSGTFQSKDVSFHVRGAYAFHDKATLGDTPIVVVAISNKGFVAAAIDEYLHRRTLIDTNFKDEETAVVYFELGLDGKYRGYSYYFGSGNGCGYCTGDAVKATTKVQNGRVVGRISQFGKEPSFDVTLDVPIASDDHGEALPKGGAEPGRAYAALAAAIAGGNARAARALLCDEQQKTWEAIARAGKDPLEVLSGALPGKVVVAGGFATAEHANLEARGEDRLLGAVHGEILLRRERGAWRYEDAVFAPGEK